MKYILSHPRLTKSAKPLANRIGELIGEQILVRVTPSDNNNCIIRYGNSAPLTNFIPSICNSAEYIKMAGNKLTLSEFFRHEDGVEGIKHVELYYGEPEKYPVVIRTELNRGGGVGIIVCENKDQFEHYESNPLAYFYSWSYWYNFQFELGVHILGGEIVRVFKKVRKDGLEEEKYPIRNTQRGYDFKLRENWKERYRGLEKFVKELYEIFPIQFARLDVGYDRETGGYRLIEINSAPDLSQNKNTLELYAKFLAGKIGE